MATFALATANDNAAAYRRMADMAMVIILRLEQEATKRVGQRAGLEKRWLENLRDYHGRYDPAIEKNLKAANSSSLFMNMVGPKTDAMSARLMDILFPTDDKNWGIKPTPVPHLTKKADEAARAAIQKEQQAADAAAGGDAAMAEQAKVEATAARKASDTLAAILDEAAQRAELMQEEMSDELTQSHYHAVMRDVIEDACKLGAGVCKGPVTGDKVRKGWKQKPQPGVINQDGSPVMEYQLEIASGEDIPAMRHVDIWSFFPDMDTNDINKGEGAFERHLMNKRQLRGLARLKGFDKNAIRDLLMEKPRMAAPSYMADLRNISEELTHVANDFYHVWEYSGPLDADDMVHLAFMAGDLPTMNEAYQMDPLEEVNAVIWFCQGKLLKLAIYPFDSGECMYSVFCLKKDESSVFGYGVPDLARDPQAAANAAWRAMLDNAGYTAGPQVVVAQDLIEPVNGEWKIEAKKVWKSKEGLPRDHRAFDVFNIPTMQEPMANIIGLAKNMLDEMTSMPQIAQGEQGTGVTKTAQGMALLMNSANVVFRRIVKNFDDDMTTPNIRRLYDWNMQFNPKEEIKGDYEIDARGSSVLLVREMQAQNLMLIAMNFGAHPIFGPMLRNRDVLRMLFRAQMISPNDVMLTDTQIDAVLANAQAVQDQAAKQAELEAAKLQLENDKIEAMVAQAEMQRDTQIELAEIARDVKMMELAEKMNMNLDKVAATLQQAREQIASKERIVASEAAMAERTGESAGGYV